MADENRKITAVSLSSLPEVSDPSGFWLFGSKEGEGGRLESGKYAFDNLLEFVQNVQLERRISLSLEMLETEMYIDEGMTFYRVAGRNISGLVISINGNDIVVDLNQNILVEIPAKSLIKFKVARELTDTKMFLFVYGRAKLA